MITKIWKSESCDTCHYFQLLNNLKPVNILEPVLQVPPREEGGPGGFPNLLKEEEQEEDEEEKKEYGDDE